MALSSIIGGISSGAASGFVESLVKSGIQVLKSTIEGYYELPEPVIEEIGVPSVAEYPTQDTAFQKIINLLLSDNKVKCVALHGQIGVGKTTIMQNLNNHFYNNDRFQMVIFIRVAADDDQTDQRTECRHILRKIAQRIEVDEQVDESRLVGSIKKELMNKIYLLILVGVRYQRALEGIWDSLGISEHNIDSKVVITTHYPLPLKAKCVNERVELKPLSTDEEAWKMFLDVVHKNLPPNGRYIRKKFCLRLPILICSLANSFKDEKPRIDWLKDFDKYISWAEGDDLNMIYSSLQICYERLNSQSEKKCFLYASLYPANTNIYTRHFVECCKVQGILDVDATKYTEMRRKAIDETLRHLVNAALLEEGEQMRYVRVNDLCRRFALHLSKDENSEYTIYVDNEEHEEPSRSHSWRVASWVSMVGSEGDSLPSELVGSEGDSLPSKRNFGSLETLMLQKNLKLVQIPQNCFGRMGNLLVLNLYGTKIRELPAFSRLTNLKALYLNGCSDLQKDLSQLQLLDKLEVLDIRGIRVDLFPPLTNLWCLRISYNLSGNYDGISELNKLKELTIDVEGTGIRELQPLSELTHLKVLYLNGRSNLQIDLYHIQPLQQLEILDIQGAEVNFVPYLRSLRYLRILYTHIGDYDGISQLHNLEELAIDIDQQSKQEWDSHGNEKIKETTNSLKELQIRCIFI